MLSYMIITRKINAKNRYYGTVYTQSRFSGGDREKKKTKLKQKGNK